MTTTRSDLVVERDDGAGVALEVKAAARVGGGDLKRLAQAPGRQWRLVPRRCRARRRGPFVRRRRPLYVMPIDRLWTTPRAGRTRRPDGMTAAYLFGPAARDRRACAERRASLVKWAFLAASARRWRSASGRVPSGSTWRSKRARKAALAGAVVSRGSRLACREYAAIRARMLRSVGVTTPPWLTLGASWPYYWCGGGGPYCRCGAIRARAPLASLPSFQDRMPAPTGPEVGIRAMVSRRRRRVTGQGRGEAPAGSAAQRSPERPLTRRERRWHRSSSAPPSVTVTPLQVDPKVADI